MWMRGRVQMDIQVMEPSPEVLAHHDQAAGCCP